MARRRDRRKEDPVSKRHQASRRKAYGRRQHELRERHERIRLPEQGEFSREDAMEGSVGDPFAFLDPRSPRLHFALGD
jgi:hypothetical protein